MNITNALVVDDDIAVCRILHRILAEEQYTVQTSQSVANALAAVEQKSFDVYVVDYKLPDGSGLDVTKRIRSKWGCSSNHSYLRLDRSGQEGDDSAKQNLKHL